jgi:hypothetical protein
MESQDENPFDALEKLSTAEARRGRRAWRIHDFVVMQTDELVILDNLQPK